MRVLPRSHLCTGGGNGNVKICVRTFCWELSELHSRLSKKGGDRFEKGSDRFEKLLVFVVRNGVESRSINQNNTTAAQIKNTRRLYIP